MLINMSINNDASAKADNLQSDKISLIIVFLASWFPLDRIEPNFLDRSGQATSGQVRSCHFRSGQVRSGHVRLGQVRSGQVRPDYFRSYQVKSGQLRSSQDKQGQVR